MDKIDQLLSDEVKRVAGTGAKDHFPVMSGIVTAVDEAAATCTVKLTVDGDAETSGVMINGIAGSIKGLLIVPAENSIVWVAEIDGPGKWGVVKYSTVTKIAIQMADTPELVVEAGKVVMNGGAHGGLVKAQETAERIKRLEDKVNDLIDKFQSWAPIANDGGASLRLHLTTTPPIWTVPITPLTTADYLKNDDVKH